MKVGLSSNLECIVKVLRNGRTLKKKDVFANSKVALQRICAISLLKYLVPEHPGGINYDFLMHVVLDISPRNFCANIS